MNFSLQKKSAMRVLLSIALLTVSAAALADRDHDRDRDGPRGGHGGVGHAQIGAVVDTRYHHDRAYWPRGHVVEVLPRAAISVHFGGGPFYFHEGIWYRPFGPRFVVARPPFGVIVPILPPFYTTLWVRGTPYYYANDIYYVWRAERNGYVVTEPPAEVDVNIAQTPTNSELFIYPKNGQSQGQQDSDRYECHSWASEQTKYDPTRPGGGVAAADAQTKRADYFRAMSACLEGRGYTVK